MKTPYNLGTQTAPTPSTSLDLPPSLEALISQEISSPMQPPMTGLSGAMTGMGSYMPMQQGAVPSFQEGGMVGPGGMPIRPQPEMPEFGMPTTGGPGLAAPGAMSGQAITPAQVMSEAQKFVKQNPQQYQQTQELIQAAINEGEITLEELNFMVQFAVAATQNPEMYPQLRASVISQGMADEEDLPPEYDPGLMFVLIVMGQSLQGMAQQAPSLEQVMGPPTAPQGVPGLRPSMRLGGPLPERSSNPDGTIPINAHEGEYVIPAEIVRRKGTDFFDKMIAQGRDGEAKPPSRS